MLKSVFVFTDYKKQTLDIQLKNLIEIRKVKTSQEKMDEQLGNFIKHLMIEVRAKLTPVHQDLTAQMIVRVANSIFTEQEQKYQFATLIAIESKFDNAAKSTSGAIGITQIMPKYMNDFGKLCNLKLNKNDLLIAEINMILGACQFRALLQHPLINNNVSAALVAYNAGINSKSFRQLIGLENIDNIETASYTTKFNYLTNKVSNKIKEQD